jgi:hypothetical protein
MTLAKAFEVMNKCVKNSPFRFDIEFVTLDVKRKAAGKLKVMRNCRLAGSSHNQMEHGTINVIAAGTLHEVTVHVKLIMKINGEFIN